MPHVAAISDKRHGRLHIFGLNSVALLHSVDVGAGAYPADQVDDTIVFVSTRKLESVRPVDVSSGAAFDPISLDHKPRSTTWDKKHGLALIGGADKVLVSVVDVASRKVIDVVGSGATDDRRDYGGGLACGHPGVGPGGEIILLDRIARRVELYRVGEKKYVSSVNLPSSPHHVHAVGERYFVLCEGNRASRIAPSVVMFTIKGDVLAVEQHAFVPVLDGDWPTTGGHHLTLNAAQGQVFVGTADAWLYTLSMDDLRVRYRTETGPGCGHVTLCPEAGLVVTTNHTGTFLTVVNFHTGRRVGDIEVSSPPNDPDSKTQGHTAFWSSSRKRLYTTAAQDGRFLEVDPVARKVTNEVVVKDADLIQGCVLLLA